MGKNSTKKSSHGRQIENFVPIYVKPYTKSLVCINYKKCYVYQKMLCLSKKHIKKYCEVKKLC